MQKKFEIISQQEVLGKDFKVYGDWENPLFKAIDVAEWIDYSKTSQGYYNVSKMLMTVDDDDKTTITIGNSGGKSAFLTEDGLYEVLMQSRKPIAKAFKKEVKKILKSVRKHGAYICDELLDELVKSEKLAEKYLKMLKTEKEISKQNEELIETIAEHVVELIPKANYCDNVLECENAVPVTVIAKDYGLSAEKFNKILHILEIQYKVGGMWVLYSKYCGNAYTATRTVAWDKRAVMYTVWTQKGREFLYQKLKECDILPEFETGKQPHFEW
jgi:prophage antirepressor-like protein